MTDAPIITNEDAAIDSAFSRTSIWANSDRRPVRLADVPDPRIAPRFTPGSSYGRNLPEQHARKEDLICVPSG
jgi:hypothetical protein